MSCCTTLQDFLREKEAEAREAWGRMIVYRVIRSMQENARDAGLVPRCFSVTGGDDNPLRVQLREFGWDV